MFPPRLALIAFSLGILALGYVSDLPARSVGYGFAFLAFTILIVSRRLPTPGGVFSVMLAGLVLGSAWGVIAGHRLLDKELPEPWAQLPLAVEGRVVGLPSTNSERVRFELQITSARWPRGDEVPSAQRPERVALSWYSNSGAVPDIQPGEFWHLVVKLKRPRGLVNFGGLDYQAWMLRHSIAASGYVLEGHWLASGSAASMSGLFDSWRYGLRQWLLTQSDLPLQGILVALLVGDSSYVSRSQWQLLLGTGTNHLIAISGLHVGLLAIVGYWLGLLLGRMVQLVYRSVPAHYYGYWAAIGCALFYTAMAGFNIPTQRASIMVCVFYLARIAGIRLPLSYLYFVALALVLACDPLAGFDLGFWLSFGAVGVLILGLSGRIVAVRGSPPKGVRAYFFSFLRSQRVVFLGLMPALVLAVNTLPLLAPLANLLAIPFVTFWIVPSLFIAALTRLANAPLGSLFVCLAEQGVRALMFWLERVRLLGADWGNPVLAPRSENLALLILCVLGLLLPRGIVFRSWCGAGVLALMAVPAFAPAPRPPLALTVLDVGQGMAVLVTTRHHQLVYDTGPAYSANFDAGSGILVPYLRRQGINHLDRLIISHWDQDHAGGVLGLTDAIASDRILWGELLRPGVPELFNRVSAGSNCHREPPWHWDGVDFRFLHWSQGTNDSANNRSCVLLISYGADKILLPGDIEQEVELKLLRGHELPADLTLLLAAHHGSATSSTAAFVAYTHPRWVVYSAGYKNRFRHPHWRVQQRFAAQGSMALATATSGALRFTWSRRPQFQLQAQGESEADVSVSAARIQARRYWFDQVTDY